jgi:nicotinamide mononucleotide transporter
MSMLSNIVPRREQGTTANVVQGAVIAIILTALSYAVGFGAGWITELNVLEAFAVLTSYATTFLCVMERRINYPLGAISTAAYCVLFYQFGLLASSAINAFLVVYLIYGWFRWKSDDNTRPITRMTLPSWLGHLAVAGVGYLIVVGIATLAGGTLAWTDSVILAGTILAQFMLDNKKLENWIVWAVVNVFAIYTYFNAGLPLAGFQYIFFLANTAYGFVMWKKARRERDLVMATSAVVGDVIVLERAA